MDRRAESESVGADDVEASRTPSQSAAIATDEQVEQVVQKTTVVFNKPAPDRKRLSDAVFQAASGKMTIKVLSANVDKAETCFRQEASVKYGFATSTMHPYVHRTRAMLGDRAPPMKAPPRNPPGLGATFKKKRSDKPPTTADSPPLPDFQGCSMVGRASVSAEVSKQPLTKQVSLWSSSSHDDLDDGALTSAETDSDDLNVTPATMDEFAAKQPLSAVSSLSDGSAHSSATSESNEALPVEEAALEVIQRCELPDTEKQQLFLSIVKVLHNELSAAEAADLYGLPSDTVDSNIKSARALLVDEAEMSSPPPPGMAEVEEACRMITRSSHYSADNKQRLYDAVIQTVKGELPLTQAAALHSIPFSTLHPYVKKVRVALGLIDPADASGAAKESPQSYSGASGIDLANGNSPPIRKRKRQTFQGVVVGGHGVGVLPFKPIEIPQKWKDNPEAMEEAVRYACRSCQYDDDTKKERLCSAVLEALSGRKTMKAAAAMHEVPFTTLQTYFHRSRAQLQREDGLLTALSPSDADALEPAESTSALDTPPADDASASDVGSDDSAPTAVADVDEPPPKRGKLDSFCDLLRKRKERATSDEPNETNGHSGTGGDGQSAAPATGASKRKPKKIQRQAPPAALVASPTTADPNAVWLNESDDWLARAGADSLSLPQIWDETSGAPLHVVEPRAPEEVDDDCLGEEMDYSETNEDELHALTNSQTWQKTVVQRAIKTSHYDGFQRDKLTKAILVVLHGVMSMKKAARRFNVPLGTVQTYFHRSRSMIEAVRAGGDAERACRQTSDSQTKRSAATKRSTQARKELRLGGKRSLGADEAAVGDAAAAGGDGDAPTEKQRLIDEAIERVVRSSLYAPEQKERLRNAVMRVIQGTLTINAAANMFCLPSSTVHPYVHRARAVLGDDCPAQATGPTPIVVPRRDVKSVTKLALAAPNVVIAKCSSPAPDDAEPNASAVSDDATEAGKLSLEGMSAKATLLAAKQQADAERASTTITVNLDDADRIVTELVKNSLYGEHGRQRLYEAILMVVTDSATTSEAARTYQIPPSTIQPYVVRARAALNPPSNAAALTAAKKTASLTPKVYAQPGDEADEEEVREIVNRVVKNCSDTERKEKLLAAVFGAVSGRVTIKDACTAQGLPASTVHPYVSRARHILGSKCPTPKIVATPNRATPSSQAPDSPAVDLPDAPSTSGSPPASPAAVAPFDESALSMEEQVLREELTTILSRYNFRGDPAKLIEAIAIILGEKKTLAEVSNMTGLAQTTLSTYVRIARLFLKETTLSAVHEKLAPKIALAEIENSAAEAEATAKPRKQSPRLSSAKAAAAAAAKPLSVRTDGGAAAAAAGAQSTPSPRLPKLQSPRPAKDSAKEAALLSDMLGQGGADADAAHEARVKATIEHLVSQQYRRGLTAQQSLIEAVEDVLLSGLSLSEALRNHTGLSEHVLNVYVGRVRGAQQLLGQPLNELYTLSAASRSRPRAPDCGRKKKPAGASPPEAALSPTRVSQRLQARAEAAERERSELDSQLETLGVLAVEQETALADYLRRLDAANFPIPSKFIVGLAKDIGKRSKHLSIPNSTWEEWLSVFQKKYALSR